MIGTMTREELHRTYGGEITDFDFGGHSTMKDIADRIFRDKAFDRQCRKNVEAREKRKEYNKKLDSK